GGQASRSRPARPDWRKASAPSPSSAGEGENDAPVLPSLVLDFHHRDRTDLAGAAHMGPAAGLQINAGYVEKPHAALAGGRLHRHGAYQLGLGRELLVG